MSYKKETIKKINELLKDNPELREKVMSGDIDAIRDIGIISERGISSEDVINYFDNNKQEELYNYAKKLLGLRELYTELCIECNKESTKRR